MQRRECHRATVDSDQVGDKGLGILLTERSLCASGQTKGRGDGQLSGFELYLRMRKYKSGEGVRSGQDEERSGASS